MSNNTDFEKGIELYAKGDFESAIEHFLKAIGEADARAYNELGFCYLYGQGTDMDVAKAVECFITAYNNGIESAEAICEIGFAYEDGKYIEQNYEEAAKWYRISAELGYSIAQHSIGWLYENGFGVMQDYTEAVKWYRMGAKNKDNPDGDAMNDLGLCYYYGKGVKTDYEKAFKWFNKAMSEHGVANAYHNIGLCYYNGYGVKQSFSQAVKYWKISAEKGIAASCENLAVCYERGEGVLFKSAKKAEEYRKKAGIND